MKGILEIAEAKHRRNSVIMKGISILMAAFLGLSTMAAELPTPKSEPLETVFGGVGRQYETWHAGLDLMPLSTPHTSAHRRISVSNRSLWLECWPDDHYGVKAFRAVQHFQSFGSNKLNINTSHYGGLAKLRFPVNPDWYTTAGFGLAQTVTELEKTSKTGTSLVTEFRIGMRFLPQLLIEGGILTFDGASGDNPSDMRMGSTNYVIGFQSGF